MDKQKQTNKRINYEILIKELGGRALFAQDKVILRMANRGVAWGWGPIPIPIAMASHRRPRLLTYLNKFFKGQLELVHKFTRMIIIRKEWAGRRWLGLAWSGKPAPTTPARLVLERRRMASRALRQAYATLAPKVQFSFILPLVLSKIEWGKNINNEPITSDYYLAVGILSLTALVSFYIAMVYFFSIYLLQHYNMEARSDKYPKFNKIIKYYEKTGFYFIMFSCIVCVVALLVLCFTGFLLYYKFIVLN